ncbi:hypothetical protein SARAHDANIELLE_52 [Hafnia phage vB_HpaM_SarahDanielle]|uniref:Uncharacterized protein n=1 Tax=Hafnia phage vB_HpaM_SarahDanielle TaxID=2836113 RepID=A0AAE8BC37_9CAUD|nr:hypothetical protein SARAHDANIELLE_52 [Hafnia phage vB_HpaM_SarahDanielle]
MKSVHLVMSAEKDKKMVELSTILYAEAGRGVEFKATTVKKDNSGMRSFNAVMENNLIKALRGDNLTITDTDINDYRTLHLPTLVSLEFKDTIYLFIDDIAINKMMESYNSSVVALGQSLKQLLLTQTTLVNAYQNMLS